MFQEKGTNIKIIKSRENKFNIFNRKQHGTTLNISSNYTHYYQETPNNRTENVKLFSFVLLLIVTSIMAHLYL